MKRLILGFLLAGVAAWAQPVQPGQGVSKCVIPIYAVASGTHFPSTTGFDNRQDGCANWVLYTSNIGFSGVSVLVESAPAAASNASGTYVSFAGTVSVGANPTTATTQCGTGCLQLTGYYPWIRVTTTLTGSGALVGVLYGDPTPASNIAPITVTVPSPLPVDGPTAAGSAPTSPPVLISGIDGTNIRTFRTDTTGYVVTAPSSTTLADNVSNTANLPSFGGVAGSQRSFPFIFDGSTWDRQFACTNQASFNLSGSGDTQIIAASGSTVIRICSLSFSTTATEDIKVTRGTGSNCGTGTADVTGLYKSVQSAVFNWGPEYALLGAASGAICLNQSAVQALGGIVIYAQY